MRSLLNQRISQQKKEKKSFIFMEVEVKNATLIKIIKKT